MPGEILLCALTLAVLGWSLFGGNQAKPLALIGVGLVAAALVWAVWGGLKLTMLPLLAAAIVAIVGELLHVFRPQAKPLMSRKGLSIPFIALGAVSLTLTLICMPTFRVRQQETQYPVGQRTMVLVDSARQDPYFTDLTPTHERRLRVKLFYPAAHTSGFGRAPYINGAALIGGWGYPASLGSYLNGIKSNSYLDAPPLAKQKLPLVILSHGIGNVPEMYTSLAERLAGNGYIVACINHTDYSAYADVGVALLPELSMDIEAALGQKDKGSNPIIPAAIRITSADMRFVIAELKAGRADPEIFQLIDFNNIAVAGHSFGGATSAQALYEDPSIKAGIDLDGPIYGDALQGVAQPFLLITSDRQAILDAVKRGGNETNVAILQHFFDSTGRMRDNSTGTFTTVSIRGSSHSSFTDMLLYAPFKFLDSPTAIAPARALDITGDYMLAFLNQQLRGQGSGVAGLSFPEATVEVHGK